MFPWSRSFLFIIIELYQGAEQMIAHLLVSNNNKEEKD